MHPVQHILDHLPECFRGPGGAIAVIRDGQLVGQQVWGFADLAKRIPMTAETLMPICSISKQMVCGVLEHLARRLKTGDGRAPLRRALVEQLAGTAAEAAGITLEHLCHNQSGIRDYWALTTLWGAYPEGVFSLTEDAAHMRQRLGTPHFVPGTQYAYSNTNFHLLARVVEQAGGRSLASLLQDHLFDPAGMHTAGFCRDTTLHPAPCVGHEGDEQNGYFEARNQVQWSRDAGVVASLLDMVAYERYLHRQWAEPGSVYRQLTSQPTFADGTLASYGNGLAHTQLGRLHAIGHAGALRGYRLQRLHVPRQGLSVVVMFNHQADATAAAEHVLNQILGAQAIPAISIEHAPDWTGDYLDPTTQLAIRVQASDVGIIRVSFAGYTEHLSLLTANSAQSREMQARIEGNRLVLQRFEDNLNLQAERLPKGWTAPDTSLDGKYYCAEIDATFTCHTEGGVLYGAFDGFLGAGPMQRMHLLSRDTWLLDCPRGMDAPAPGNWTLLFERNASGKPQQVVIGCWLARGLTFIQLLSSG